MTLSRALALAMTGHRRRTHFKDWSAFIRSTCFVAIVPTQVAVTDIGDDSGQSVVLLCHGFPGERGNGKRECVWSCTREADQVETCFFRMNMDLSPLVVGALRVEKAMVGIRDQWNTHGFIVEQPHETICSNHIGLLDVLFGRFCLFFNRRSSILLWYPMLMIL